MRPHTLGRVTPLLERGCGGCTAVSATGDASAAATRLIVLTTGALLEAGKQPAQVLALDLR